MHKVKRKKQKIEIEKKLGIICVFMGIFSFQKSVVPLFPFPIFLLRFSRQIRPRPWWPVGPNSGWEPCARPAQSHPAVVGNDWWQWLWWPHRWNIYHRQLLERERQQWRCRERDLKEKTWRSKKKSIRMFEKKKIREKVLDRRGWVTTENKITAQNTKA